MLQPGQEVTLRAVILVHAVIVLLDFVLLQIVPPMTWYWWAGFASMTTSSLLMLSANVTIRVMEPAHAD